MNSEITIKQNFEKALKNFDKLPLRAAATTLLNTLGYYSRRIGNDDLDNERFERLIASELVMFRYGGVLSMAIINRRHRKRNPNKQVFENILGVYNPESETAAHKTTSSYYTPRQIVYYMVDESLIAYFLQKVEPYDGEREWLEEWLGEDLLAYDKLGEVGRADDHLTHEDEIEPILKAIDTRKIIRSGCRPRGISYGDSQ